ncbi:hypothetical protein GmHk_06G017221 [Glycine max]|nr:hypothetical protein GmHk_06G017221 [Glycine max]
MDVIGDKILLDLFYHQPVYVEFSSKSPIELNATFGQSLNEILALLRKPRNQDLLMRSLL